MKKPYVTRMDALELGLIAAASFLIGWIAYGIFRAVLASV